MNNWMKNKIEKASRNKIKVRFSNGWNPFIAFIPRDTENDIETTVQTTQWFPGEHLFGLWEQKVKIRKIPIPNEPTTPPETRLWYESDTGNFIRCKKAATFNDYPKMVSFPE